MYLATTNFLPPPWIGVTGGDVIDSVITQGRAAGLLGCGDTAVNKINGMSVLAFGFVTTPSQNSLVDISHRYREKFDDGSAVW